MHLWNFENILLWLIGFDLAGLLDGFLSASWAHLFKYFRNSFWKKKQKKQVDAYDLAEFERFKQVYLTAF